MSRSGYVDEEDEHGQFALWHGRVMSATRGKRGQALLREIEAALLALPTRELIADKFCTKEGKSAPSGPGPSPPARSAAMTGARPSSPSPGSRAPCSSGAGMPMRSTAKP